MRTSGGGVSDWGQWWREDQWGENRGEVYLWAASTLVMSLTAGSHGHKTATVTSTPVMSALEQVTAKSLGPKQSELRGERKWGRTQGVGGSTGSCSGKMTSKPVMSSSSHCCSVTRQRQTEVGRGMLKIVSWHLQLSCPHLNWGQEIAVLTRRREPGMEEDREDGCKSQQVKGSRE